MRELPRCRRRRLGLDHAPVGCRCLDASRVDAAADRRALVTPRLERNATLPFVGLVEAFLLTVLRSAGFPMARDPAGRRAGDRRARPSPCPRVLADARRRVAILAAFVDSVDARRLTGGGRDPFAGSFRGHLSCITYGSNGWTEQLRLSMYEDAEVIVDRTKPSARAARPRGSARRGPRGLLQGRHHRRRADCRALGALSDALERPTGSGIATQDPRHQRDFRGLCAILNLLPQAPKIGL